MDRKGSKNENVHEKSFSLPRPPPTDELFSVTDSEGSSSSSDDRIFEVQPVVMEMHGTEKDELPDNPLPEVKTRKLLKKKRPKPDQEQTAASMSSGSESSMVPPGPEKQEEFYDAHESYYDFPENQTSHQALRGLAIVSSHQDTPTLKAAQETTELSDATTTTAARTDTATGRTPIASAVTKPVPPQEPE